MSRADAQDRNRARVLAAARAEFTERGFRDAKIDAIAERAELTRGAVYSNFPGKRALYFAVLAEDADVALAVGGTTEGGDPGSEAWDAASGAPSVPSGSPTHGGTSVGSAAVGRGAIGRGSGGSASVGGALGAFARAWLGRLPLATDEEHSGALLGADLMPEILADELTRRPFTQLTQLSAILLGLALEQLRPTASRRVQLAEIALTTLHGASQLAAAAPGFGEPFTIVSACEHLADLDLDDRWQAPHVPHIPQARPVDEAWGPPPALDAITRSPALLTSDGIVAILGLHRLAAIEEAVRAAPPNTDVTAVLVTSAPEELGPLARLVIADFRTSLHQAFPRSAWPRLQVVHDDSGALARAAGVASVSDATETAVRVRTGRIVARADGYGACHAAATATN